jgi:hypothetical protein
MKQSATYKRPDLKLLSLCKDTSFLEVECVESKSSNGQGFTSAGVLAAVPLFYDYKSYKILEVSFFVCFHSRSFVSSQSWLTFL